MSGVAVATGSEARAAPWGRYGVGGAAALLLVGITAADGGYFASAWGWIALALLWAAAIALLVRSAAVPSRLELVAVAAFVGLGVFLAVSAAWTDEPYVPRELARMLVYVAAAIAFSLLLRQRTLLAAVGGAVAGAAAVSVYAVATRLFPDRFGSFDPIAGYRLAEPIGYWNGLAIFAAISILLALALALRDVPVRLRVAPAAALVPLSVALYFTFSRGGWLALAIGLVVLAALHPARLRLTLGLLAVVPAPAAAVLIASRFDALTTQNASVTRAADDGRTLAAVAVVLIAIAALSPLLARVLERRVADRVVDRRLGIAVAAIATLTLLAATIALADDAYDAFAAPPPPVDGSLNQRLFSFSGSGRLEQWEVALEAYRSEPLTGVGAGGYERYWLEHREVAGKIRDAHSLYLEVLAELGPLGLGLLVAALALPLAAVQRARRHPLVPFAAAGYVAFLAHAGVDWDWELPAVTLLGLLCAWTILVAARSEPAAPLPARSRRVALVGTTALIAVAFVGLAGNLALAQSADAARAADWEESERKARRAATWAPWSPEPWQRIGQAQLARGELARARESFRTAIAHDERDWELWLDLARASSGRAQQRALAQATRLNPLSPEVAQLRTELGELGTIEVGG